MFIILFASYNVKIFIILNKMDDEGPISELW